MKIKIYSSLLFLLWFFCTGEASGQMAGDYRSFQTGSWGIASNWERFDGVNWIAASTHPTSGDGVIIIQAFHTITVSAQITADQIFVLEDGALTIDSGGHLIVNNGAGANDLEVESFFIGGLLNVNSGGILENRGNIFAPEGTAFVNAGGTYTHNTNGGEIVMASWDPTSKCNVTGITSTLPSKLSQNFGNFTWNCPAQSGNFDLAGTLNSVAGNLEIRHTGGRRLPLSNTAAATINVGGNFVVTPNTYTYLTNSGTVTLNVAGNFDYSATNPFIITGSGTGIVNVGGNFTASAGTIRFVQLTSGTPTAKLNVKGNLKLSNTTFNMATNAGATATVTFEGTTLQTYSRTNATIAGAINFIAKSNSIVDLGTSIISGDGGFTLETGAEIKLASTSTAGAITDQIAVLGTKTYVNGGTITLNGTSVQYVGAGFPNAALNLNINNPAGVSLSDNLLVGNGATLNLLQGNLTLGTRTLTFNGSLTSNTGNFLVFDGNSSIIISKSNAFGNIPYAANSTLGNLTINGASTTANLSNNLIINNLTFNNGSSLSIGANKLTLIEKLNNLNGGFNADSSSVVEIGANIDPANNALGTISFVGGNTVSELIINRPGGSVDLPTTLNIAKALRLQNGIINNTAGSLYMLGDATIFKNAGSSLSNPPSIATFYNLHYGGTLTTGNELIAGSATVIKNVTLPAGAVVSLDPNITQAITINGTLQNDGNFNMGSETVHFKGNIINNSSFTAGTSNAVFSGTSALSGTINISLYNVEITGSLTASSNQTLTVGGNWIVNAGTFNPNSGTTAFNGTNTQLITSAGQPFHNVELSNGAAGISMQDNMDVNGALVSMAPLNLNTYALNVGGNLTLNTPITATIGSQLVLDGGAQTITTNGNSIGSALTIGGTGTKSLGDPLTVSGNIQISSTLSVGINNYAVTAGGNWTNNGTFQSNTGTVTFNGNSQQTLSGTSTTVFHHINIRNVSANGLVLQGPAHLKGTLTLADLANGAKINTNGNLTLLSTTDNGLGDARIASIPATAVFNGGVTIQRYMSGEGRFYRYLSSPVSGATVASWQDDFKIIGNFTGSSPGYIGAPSMYYYFEPTTGAIDQGWMAYPPSGTSNTQPLVKGVGYSAYIDEGNAPVIIDVSGPIYKGDHTLALRYTNTGNVDADGWNLIGNIYPSQIDWASIPLANFTNTARAFYITDGGDGGTTRSWVDGVGTNLGNNESQIAIGQGFYVKATGPSPSIKFTESIKTAASTPFYRTAPPADYVRIALKQGSKRDESIIRFKKEATASYDKDYDAIKFPNTTVFNLSSLSGDSKFAINTLKEISCGANLSLAIENVTEGNYQMEFSEFNSFSEPVEIVLTDKFTNTAINVLEENSYSFSVTKNPASFGQGRFTVEVKKAAINNSISLSGNKVCEGNGLSLLMATSQQGINYQAYLGNEAASEVITGNGNMLSLQVAPELLPLGTHSIQVKAFREGCESTYLANSYSVTVGEQYEVSSVRGGSRCGQGSVELSATGAPENGSYRWYSSADAVTPIAETRTEPFKSPELKRTKTFYVAAANEYGCEGVGRVEVKAEVKNLEQPLIEEKEGILYSSHSEGNQWFKEGVRIEGATGSSFSPNTNGNYTVAYANGSCTVSSDPYNFQLLKSGDDLIQAGISIRPNPVVDWLNVSWTNPDNEEVQIKIITSNGTIVDQHTLYVKNNDQINNLISVAKLSQGLYILQIQGKNAIYQFKFIKQ